MRKIAIFFFFFALIAYLANHNLNSLKNTIVQNQKLLTWMIPAGNEINQLRQASIDSAANKQASSLLALIDKESKINAWNNYLMEMKQSENNQVEVSFSRINFDDLISGLEQLSVKNNIQITRINVKRIESTSFVQANMFLQILS